MHPTTQVIVRNLQRRDTCASGLWINPEKDDGWRRVLSRSRSLRISCQEYGPYRYFQQSGADVEFAAFPQFRNRGYPWVILNLPRQKALLRMLLEWATGLLREDGVLWLVGENRAGIKSAGTPLKACFASVTKLDSARHCSLYEAARPIKRDAMNPLDYRRQWPLEGKSASITVVSYPGVFAHGRLDAGTSLLLDAMDALPIEGDVLDFACGAGVVGTSIAAQHRHARVTLLDNHALALRACAETLAINHVDGTVLASDGLSELAGRFDLVVSNPPVHSGVRTDSHLGMRLLDSLHGHIRPGGALLMVANIHLPYENWLSGKFRNVSQPSGTDHYKVILAKN